MQEILDYNREDLEATFHHLATRLDLDVMWVQSPGRWMIDGHDLPTRMFGLHAVVRHEPHTPSELRHTLAAVKERHGLNVEASPRDCTG